MQGRKQQGTQEKRISAGSERTPAAVIQVGSVLNNRFLLQEVLGVGGMGRVYKALDLRREEVQDPSPYVAIKLLNESVRNMTGAGIALQREAVIAQRLQHPCIASVYDYNRDEFHAYIVMELIEGYTLDQLIISDYPDGLPAAQSFRVIGQLIETVIFAHQKGVVHADIKPSNVKVMPTGDIKVMDFGLARVMSLMNMTQDNNKDLDAHWRHRSLSDAITPSYATKARLHGRQPIKIDDTYALACVIYLVLSGRHPYHRMNADKVLKQGIKPARPPHITSKQWSVLLRALDPNINKESGVLNALSGVFCKIRRKAQHQKRKLISIAALLLSMYLAIPINTWVSDQLPVWLIQYASDEQRVEALTQYLSGPSSYKQKTLEGFYLPTLVSGWQVRWSGVETLLSKPFPEQQRLLAALKQDLVIADLVTPYLSANKLFSESRAQLEQVRSKYLIEILAGYEARLSSYLTNNRSVLDSDMNVLYNHTRLLDLIDSSSVLMRQDPRLRLLLFKSMNEDWIAGRYLPLGEKLQFAKVLFPESQERVVAIDKLGRLMSTDLLLGNEAKKEALFTEEILANETPSYIYTPTMIKLVKEIKIASSNQLDLIPAYRDRLTDTHKRFISFGGDEYYWQQLVSQAELEYSRTLASWGRTEEAFQVVDKMLARQLKY